MSDCVLEWMLKNKIPITQRSYIEFAYMGEKHSLEELEGEQVAELPEGFEEWPKTEQDIN